jgi:hypothetical protein
MEHPSRKNAGRCPELLPMTKAPRALSDLGTARHGVAHGMGNAILLPHVMRFNVGRPEGAKRLKDVAAALGLTVPNDPVEAANLAADKVTERRGPGVPEPALSGAITLERSAQSGLRFA